MIVVVIFFFFFLLSSPKNWIVFILYFSRQWREKSGRKQFERSFTFVSNSCRIYCNKIAFFYTVIIIDFYAKDSRDRLNPFFPFLFQDASKGKIQFCLRLKRFYLSFFFFLTIISHNTWHKFVLNSQVIQDIFFLSYNTLLIPLRIYANAVEELK